MNIFIFPILLNEDSNEIKFLNPLPIQLIKDKGLTNFNYTPMTQIDQDYFIK